MKSDPHDLDDLDAAIEHWDHQMNGTSHHDALKPVIMEMRHWIETEKLAIEAVVTALEEFPDQLMKMLGFHP